MKLFSGFLLYILIFLGNTGCNKSGSDSVKAVAQQDNMNVSYGSASAQKMDVYLPAERTTTNTKVILFIHGGSWSGGDKSDFDSAIPVLRVKLPDYAFFNMNYRLAYNSSNKFPAQIDDIQKALDYIASKATDYKIDAGKIVLIGGSAGAHLALLQAYKNNGDGKIKAVVDLFGPTDLVTLYSNHPFPAASQPTLVNFLGTTPSANPDLYKTASPINFVTASSVPTQIFHGAADYVVPVNQSTILKAKLDAVNVKTEMVVYPNEGHGWYGSNLIDTYTRVINFIKQNVP